MSLKTINDYRKEIDEKGIETTYENIFKTIEEKDEKYKIFLSIEKDYAYKRIDEIKKRDNKGRLFGIPIAIKDNIAVKGLQLTCGSKILDGFVSPYSATVIERLEAEGAVIVGKTNMDEFAMGSSNENSAYFNTKNPINAEYVPGGSSGGSAAAVSSNSVPIALGSDTGGSVRQPASFTNTFGFRPTYGSISRYGLVAFASSLDIIGPIANSIEDIKLVYDIISGKDEKDSTSIDIEKDNLLKENLRIGFINSDSIKDIDKDIYDSYYKYINELENLGYEIDEIDSKLWNYSLNSYYIIASSEASSNLSRFDGVRYGLRNEGNNLNEMYLYTRTKGFGREVKRRIFLGTFSLSSGYYDKYYKKASQLREMIKQEFHDNFKRFDFIITPTTPEFPFKFNQKKDPIKMYLSDWFTVPSSLANLPSISIPFIKNEKNLPAGLQIISNYGKDYKLMEFIDKIIVKTGGNK